MCMRKSIILTAVFLFLGEACMSAQKTVLEENSLFQKSQKTGLEYVLRLDPDRLLAPCRIAAGKRPKAATYGGWESMQIQGHSLGHYMSALSAFVNST